MNHITNIPKQRENEKVEFKTTFSKAVIETLVAFANSKAGSVLSTIKGANHLMSASDIAESHLQSMQYSWDAYPYSKATYNDLNEDKIKDFIAKVNVKGRFKLPNNPKEALIKLRLLKEEVPSNAAMILFSKENLLYNVHIGRFKLPSLIVADNMISGNLYDVVEKSMQYIISHIKFAFEITGKTTQRIEIPEYPLDAIRELLLNAIIHRNYQSSTDIQIKIFDQSITFFNPSGLCGNITVEDLKTDTYTASTRNKLIAEAFYLTKDIEKYGSGFTRIRKEIKDYPTMEFLYENRNYGFFTELKYVEQRIKINSIKELGKELNENQLMMIKLIAKNRSITIEELTKSIRVSSTAIENNIAKLKQKGILKRVGGRKSGYWEIVKDMK